MMEHDLVLFRNRTCHPPSVQLQLSTAVLFFLPSRAWMHRQSCPVPDTETRRRARVLSCTGRKLIHTTASRV